jgi:hypothetical protein
MRTELQHEAKKPAKHPRSTPASTPTSAGSGLSFELRTISSSADRARPGRWRAAWPRPARPPSCCSRPAGPMTCQASATRDNGTPISRPTVTGVSRPCSILGSTAAASRSPWAGCSAADRASTSWAGREGTRTTGIISPRKPAIPGSGDARRARGQTRGRGGISSTRAQSIVSGRATRPCFRLAPSTRPRC